MRSILACLILLLMVSQSLFAQGLSLAGSYYYFDYEEFDVNGRQLNNETGHIPSLGLSWSYRLLSQTKVSFGLKYATSSVDYSGFTQRGQPHETTTDQTFKDIELELRHRLSVLDLALEPVLGVTKRSWRRAIQAKGRVSYLNEDYRWYEWRVGLDARLPIGPGFLVGGVNKLFLRNGTIQVETPIFGSLRPTLGLGDGDGLLLSLAYLMKLHPSKTLSCQLFYKEWGHSRGHSELIPTDRGLVSITEPKNETRINGVVLSYAYDF